MSEYQTAPRSAPAEATDTTLRKVPDPCVVIIFGASGDLTRRKLMAALFSLTCEGLAPEDFAVVGVARSELDYQGFQERVQEGVEAYGRIKPDELCEKWPVFA